MQVCYFPVISVCIGKYSVMSAAVCAAAKCGAKNSSEEMTGVSRECFILVLMVVLISVSVPRQWGGNPPLEVAY